MTTATEIPAAAMHLVQVYNLPWPDVDEHGFTALRSPLQELGRDLRGIGDEMTAALEELHSASPSRTVRSLIAYLEAVRRDFLDPLEEICALMAGAPCQVAHDGVLALKATLVQMMAAVGPGEVAEAALLGDAMALAMRRAEAEIVAALTAAAGSVTDRLVRDLISPFTRCVADWEEGDVDTYAPRLVLAAALGIEDTVGSLNRLRLSESQIEQAVKRVGCSTDHLYDAAAGLERAVEEIFSRPQAGLPVGPSVSAELRHRLAGEVETACTDLVSAIGLLVEEVARHLVTLLRGLLGSVGEGAGSGAAARP